MLGTCLLLFPSCTHLRDSVIILAAHYWKLYVNFKFQGQIVHRDTVPLNQATNSS